MKRVIVFTALAAMLSFLLSSSVAFGLPGGMDNRALDRLAAMRVTGLSGDSSQISTLRAIVKNPYPDNRKGYLPPASQLLVITALRSLARLGATEALPDINQLIVESKEHSEVANYAKVQQARLLAESDTGGIFDRKAHVIAVIDKLYSGLGLTQDDFERGSQAVSAPTAYGTAGRR